MQYLYTTTPDKFCHEVSEGVYGRPVHTSEAVKLKAKGWKVNPNDLREKETEHVRHEEKAQEDEEIDLRALYKEKFGKDPHHKMKDATILKKLEESDDQ